MAQGDDGPSASRHRLLRGYCGRSICAAPWLSTPSNDQEPQRARRPVLLWGLCFRQRSIRVIRPKTTWWLRQSQGVRLAEQRRYFDDPGGKKLLSATTPLPMPMRRRQKPHAP